MELDWTAPETPLEVASMKSVYPILKPLEKDGANTDEARLVINLTREPDEFELLAHKVRRKSSDDETPKFKLRRGEATVKVKVHISALPEAYHRISSEFDLIARDAGNLRLSYKYQAEKVAAKVKDIVKE